MSDFEIAFYFFVSLYLYGVMRNRRRYGIDVSGGSVVMAVTLMSLMFFTIAIMSNFGIIAILSMMAMWGYIIRTSMMGNQ